MNILEPTELTEEIIARCKMVSDVQVALTVLERTLSEDAERCIFMAEQVLASVGKDHQVARMFEHIVERLRAETEIIERVEPAAAILRLIDALGEARVTAESALQLLRRVK